MKRKSLIVISFAAIAFLFVLLGIVVVQTIDGVIFDPLYFLFVLLAVIVSGVAAAEAKRQGKIEQAGKVGR
jgi:hypothetical protein